MSHKRFTEINAHITCISKKDYGGNSTNIRNIPKIFEI